MAEQQTPQLLKVTVHHYQDHSHDEETWLKWYMEEQIPRFIPVAHKHGIDRCELVRIRPSMLSILLHLQGPPVRVGANGRADMWPSRWIVCHASGVQAALPGRPRPAQGRMRRGLDHGALRRGSHVLDVGSAEGPQHAQRPRLERQGGGLREGLERPNQG